MQNAWKMGETSAWECSASTWLTVGVKELLAVIIINRYKGRRNPWEKEAKETPARQVI